LLALANGRGNAGVNIGPYREPTHRPGLADGIWASSKSLVPLAVDYPAVGLTRRIRHAGLARKDMKP